MRPAHVDAREAKGIQIGDHNVQINVSYTGPAVRSAYREQVRRIAPLTLRGREAELEELACFCSADDEPQQSPYAWWRADAWTGKTALMSWFVLHPPRGVQLVPFFVTGRYAGQSDRVAFADVVMEQLAELLHCQMPAYLTEATRDAHFLGMLAEAARVCGEENRRLVLLVDGLDEDTGVTAGPGAHSIAGLLPAVPPAGLRIVVSGRRSPPVPDDVPAGHPLRAPVTVRDLAKSPYAQAVRADARKELQVLLHGSEAQQELLGLVTAAGGGLSGSDLAELTGLDPWQVDEQLTSVTGRTFSRRLSRDRPDAAPEVYLLAHEELQSTATDVLGPAKLDAYRGRLNTWADRYRARRWPQETPEYLLRGYFKMLHATGDVAGMLACATDADRLDRMLDVTGGDNAALAEITTVQQDLLARPSPDLSALLTLSMGRSALLARNALLDGDLPSLWARLGHIGRAESLAHVPGSAATRDAALERLAETLGQMGRYDKAAAVAGAVCDRARRTDALLQVAEAAAGAGDHDRAEDLIDRAEGLARAARSPIDRDETLARVASLLARLGAYDRAETVIGDVSHSRTRARAWRWVVEAAAGTATRERFVALADRAEAAALNTDDPSVQGDVRGEELAQVAQILARAGHHERAESMLRTLDPSEFGRARAAASVAEAIARDGDADRAETVARTLTGDYHHPRQSALAAIAVAVAEGGDPGRAAPLLSMIEDEFDYRDTLVDAVSVLAAVDLDQAEALAATAEDPYAHILACTAAAKATREHPGEEARVAALADRVAALSQSVQDPAGRAAPLTAMAELLSDRGDHERAAMLSLRAREAVVMLPGETGTQLMTTLARTAAGRGDHEQAVALAAEAEALASHIPHEPTRALALAALEPIVGADVLSVEDVARLFRSPTVLVALAHTLVDRGERERAAALAATAQQMAIATAPLVRRTDVLITLSKATTLAGDPGRASALAAYAETIVRSEEPADGVEWGLVPVVEATALAGHRGHAETAARSFVNTVPHDDALAAVARACADAGEYDRAESLAAAIVSPTDRAHVCSVLASAAAAAGRRDPASDLCNRAKTAIAAIDHRYAQASALAELAEAVMDTADIDRATALAHQAEHLANSLTPPAHHSADIYDQRLTLHHVASAFAHLGDLDRAAAIADSLPKGKMRVRVLADMAAAATRRDDAERAARIRAEAEHIARSVTDTAQRDDALSLLAATGAGADPERAETAAQAIEDPDERARALTALAVGVQEPGRAGRLLAQALAVGEWTIPLSALARLAPAEVIATAEMALDELASTSLEPAPRTPPDPPVRPTKRSLLSGLARRIRPRRD